MIFLYLQKNLRNNYKLTHLLTAGLSYPRTEQRFKHYSVLLSLCEIWAKETKGKGETKCPNPQRLSSP